MLSVLQAYTGGDLNVPYVGIQRQQRHVGHLNIIHQCPTESSAEPKNYARVNFYWKL